MERIAKGGSCPRSSMNSTCAKHSSGTKIATGEGRLDRKETTTGATLVKVLTEKDDSSSSGATSRTPL